MPNPNFSPPIPTNCVFLSEVFPLILSLNTLANIPNTQQRDLVQETLLLHLLYKKTGNVGLFLASRCFFFSLLPSLQLLSSRESSTLPSAPLRLLLLSSFPLSDAHGGEKHLRVSFGAESPSLSILRDAKGDLRGLPINKRCFSVH